MKLEKFTVTDGRTTKKLAPGGKHFSVSIRPE